MVRDEVDIIGPVVAHMLGQVDHVIVADNLSVDGTFDVLESFGSQITLVADTDPAYRQSEKMTHLAGVAKSMGADWVVPFDADEWIYSRPPSTRTIRTRSSRWAGGSANQASCRRSRAAPMNGSRSTWAITVRTTGGSRAAQRGRYW